jgi:hypothetical protein
MSTRALYTFIEGGYGETLTYYNVYKHHDGYPSGAAEALNNALAFSWRLSRFEADEFAAAFVAGNKSNGSDGGFKGGGVRLMPSGKPTARIIRHCSDIEYRYEIQMMRGEEEPTVTAYAMGESIGDSRELFCCSLSQMAQVAETLNQDA